MVLHDRQRTTLDIHHCNDVMWYGICVVSGIITLIDLC